MQTSNENHEETSEFSKLTGQTFENLESTKKDLEQKAKQLNELQLLSNEQFASVMKVNKNLKEKVIFLQDLSSALNTKNDELEKANKALEKQKLQNSKLTVDLRKSLEKVVLKEKDLGLQRDHLVRRVQEQTSELIKSERLAIIGELASRMAHDLRNPLAIIKNVVEIIETKPQVKIDEKLRHFGQLRRAIERMSHQVEDVLDFVRTTELRLVPYSVLDLLNSCMENITIPSGVKLEIEQNDVTINCDFRKIEAVFTNLILNAIQAVNNNGYVKIRIMDSDKDVLIAFEDSGRGVSQDNFSKIFEPLFTTKQTGTGLGLSICKSVIEQHGGSITVKNDPTTFILRLPKNL